jgi:hypothetical protein
MIVNMLNYIFYNLKFDNLIALIIIVNENTNLILDFNYTINVNATNSGKIFIIRKAN